MSTYLEAAMLSEHELEQEAKREEVIRSAVTSCLDELDRVYPQFKKSSGPFGDKLAGDIHKRIERAFGELELLEQAEIEELAKLQRKYRKGV